MSHTITLYTDIKPVDEIIATIQAAVGELKVIKNGPPTTTVAGRPTQLITIVNIGFFQFKAVKLGPEFKALKTAGVIYRTN